LLAADPRLNWAFRTLAFPPPFSFALPDTLLDSKVRFTGVARSGTPVEALSREAERAF
jgi:hypothetical protein